MSDLVRSLNDTSNQNNSAPSRLNSRTNSSAVPPTVQSKEQLNSASNSSSKNGESHGQDEGSTISTVISIYDPTKIQTQVNGSSSPGVSKLTKLSRLLPMSRKSSQIVSSSDSNRDEGIQLEEIVTKQVDLHVNDSDAPPPSNNIRDGTSNESLEDACRICHDNSSRMTLLSPCLCKGSMGKVHRVCLERWLGESAKTNCEICGHEYETERRPRYTGWRSVVAWIRNPLAPTDTRNLFFDLACFFILTPLAAISAWLCVVGAMHYQFGQRTLNPKVSHPDLSPLQHDDLKGGRGHHKFKNKGVEPANSTWTSIGLLTLTGTLLAAYYVWLFVAARYHIQVWREWQARNFVVTISPSNPDRIRELRYAVVAVDPHRASGHITPEVVASRRTSNNKNCNCRNVNHNYVDNSVSSNNNGEEQRKLREKTLTRAFEETSSMNSNGTISTSLGGTKTNCNGAGPSDFNCTKNDNSDVDSVQGKVIVIPSTFNLNQTLTTRTPTPREASITPKTSKNNVSLNKFNHVDINYFSKL